MTIEKLEKINLTDDSLSLSANMIICLTPLCEKINELIDAFNSTMLFPSHEVRCVSEEIARRDQRLDVLEFRLQKLESQTENSEGEEEILGCPWCNQKPVIDTNHNDLWSAWCTNNLCKTECLILRECKTKQEAIRAWNTREK